MLQSSPSRNIHGVFNSLQGIVAFTFNDHDVARMEKQQLGEGSRSKGVIGEVFEVYHLHFLCKCLLYTNISPCLSTLCRISYQLCFPLNFHKELSILEMAWKKRQLNSDKCTVSCNFFRLVIDEMKISAIIVDLYFA